jgi:predicted nucleotide-binding protein
VPYHVRISHRQRRSHDEVILDLNEEELDRRFLTPYREGRPITTRGRTFPLSDIERLRINFTEESATTLAPRVRAEREAAQHRSGIAVLGGPSNDWYVAARGEDVTDRFITGPPGSARPTSDEAPGDSAENDSRRVMVVHGRNVDARDAMFSFLRAIGLEPLEWTELVSATGKGSPYIGDILDHGFALARAVVVLMTPDDEGRTRSQFVAENDPPHERDLTPQARPNVLFEAGLAFGRFPERTIIVELGTLRPFTDIGGRHTIRLDDSSQRRQELALRLRDAGCSVNLDGTDWHRAGTFDDAVRDP